ncbi:MAG: glycosyltransferase, partial [Bacteroidales bacterium]|nr:glycosyltransferase [Bacteroidales bacterium]
NNIDIVCLPSICAETFSYTLSESLMCRIPVIGLNIGAIAQRIRAIDAGWVLPIETDAKELFKVVKLLSNDNYNDYLKKIENIDKNYNSLPTVTSMCEKYNALYSSLIKEEIEYINNTSFYKNEDTFVTGIEIDKSGREYYRTLRDRITSENLSFKEIISEIKIFRKRYPQSKLRNKIAFKLLWHKFGHKNIQ